MASLLTHRRSRAAALRLALLLGAALGLLSRQASLWADSGPGEANEPSSGGKTVGTLAEVLFEELTDNTETPFAVLPLFSIAGRTLTVRITKHFILLALTAVLVLASMFYLAHKLRRPFRPPTRLQGLLEVLVDYMRKNVIQPVLGEQGRRFELLCLCFFLFVLYANLLGLIPPFAPVYAGPDRLIWIGGAVTGNLAVTAGLGLITFVVMNLSGMRAKGVLGYWRDLVPSGTPVWMAPITWLLELIGLFSKTLALIMRLFANMIGGHVAILVILMLIIKFQSLLLGPVALLVDLAIFMLELFVAVLQAYIFSFLSALFIGLAVRKH
jgi:F-type H+-transporting ATPase subunit a